MSLVSGEAAEGDGDMTRLLPLAQIPYTARQSESAARKRHASRAEALRAAQYEIVQAAGTYSGAYAPTVGWCCSRAAAEALAAELTHMPGNTCHHSLSYVRRGEQ